MTFTIKQILFDSDKQFAYDSSYEEVRMFRILLLIFVFVMPKIGFAQAQCISLFTQEKQMVKVNAAMVQLGEDLTLLRPLLKSLKEVQEKLGDEIDKMSKNKTWGEPNPEMNQLGRQEDELKQKIWPIYSRILEYLSSDAYKAIRYNSAEFKIKGKNYYFFGVVKNRIGLYAAYYDRYDYIFHFTGVELEEQRDGGKRPDFKLFGDWEMSFEFLLDVIARTIP